jgi:hypothetical protein
LLAADSNAIHPAASIKQQKEIGKEVRVHRSWRAIEKSSPEFAAIRPTVQQHTKIFTVLIRPKIRHQKDP